MSRRHSSRFLLFSTLCILVITVAVIRFSGAQPLVLELEISGTGVSPGSTSVVGVNRRQSLPYSFSVGRVNELTMHEVHLFTSIAPGTYVFGYKSVKPVDCCVVVDDEPSWCYDRAQHSVLVNVSECYEYYHVFQVWERCVLSFCFKTDTETLSDVTLMAVYDPGFTRYRESGAEVDEAVDTARAFLELNDVDAGKYLSHRVEYGKPNYYWQKALKQNSLANLVYKNPNELCSYIVVRFEQELRPGHFYEVWVEQDTNQVVGGDTCK